MRATRAGGAPVTVRPRATFSNSTDRKTAPLCEVDADRARPVIRNTSGTLAGVTCSGESPLFCRSCYGKKAEAYLPSVRQLLARNTDVLRSASTSERVEVYRRAVLDFLDEARRWVSIGAIAPRDLIYRHRWDGDVLDASDAWAIRKTAAEFPEVAFWLYTRTLTAVPLLLGVPNLAVYVSTDTENADRVRALVERFGPLVNVAACASTQAEARAVWDTVTAGAERRRLLACPENIGRLPLVGALDDPRRAPSAGEFGRGACASCRICIDRTADVGFSTLHK